MIIVKLTGRIPVSIQSNYMGYSYEKNVFTGKND